MGQTDYNETAFHRATKDTNISLRDDIIIAFISAVLAWFFLPEAESVSEIKSIFLCAIAGAAIYPLIIFTWNFIRAPYKQRDEARAELKMRNYYKWMAENLAELQKSMSEIERKLYQSKIDVYQYIEEYDRDWDTFQKGLKKSGTEDGIYEAYMNNNGVRHPILQSEVKQFPQLKEPAIANDFAECKRKKQTIDMMLRHYLSLINDQP